MPKVSVIIPVYNVEKYLKQCLDSVMNQTLSDIEIICIDDASTDNSLFILNEYARKDSRFVIIESRENLKQGGARNKGLDIAKSEYIMFVDADDFIQQDMIEDFYRTIKLNNCDLVISNIVNFLEDDNLYKTFNELNLYYERVNKKSGLYDVQKQISTFRTGPVAKLFKKSIIDEYNIRFPEKLIQEDEAFHWMYLPLILKVYYLETNYYKRRVHLNSTMVQKNINKKQVYDLISVYDYIYAFLKKNNLIKKVQKDLRSHFDRHYIYILSNCDNKNDFKYYKQRLKKIEYKLFLSPIKWLFSIRNNLASLHKIVMIFGIEIKIPSLKLQNRDLHKKFKYQEEQINKLREELALELNNIKHLMNTTVD